MERRYRSLKNYTKEIFLEKLHNTNFPNYENYQNVDEAYNDFFTKINTIINTIAPEKAMKIRNDAEEWLDEEIHRGIRERNKKFKRFNTTRSQPDYLEYKRSRNRIQSLIKKKGIIFKKD